MIWDLEVLQQEVCGFLRRHKQETFSKEKLAAGIASEMVASGRSFEPLSQLSSTLLEELKKHHLRFWPKVNRLKNA